MKEQVLSQNVGNVSEVFFFSLLLYPVLGKDAFEGFVHHSGLCNPVS